MLYAPEDRIGRKPALRFTNLVLALAALLAPRSAALAEETAPRLLAADYRVDTAALTALIADNYAYLDDLPGGTVPSSPVLNAERDAVHDHDSLLHYAEDVSCGITSFNAM
jgi:carboxyl-terminal processing protease